LNRSFTLAAAVAFVAAASRAVVDWRVFRPDSVPIGQLLTLLVFTVVLAHAVWMACRACSGEPGVAGTAPRAVWWLWLGVLVIGLIVWPAAFQPDRFPLASLLFFGSLAAFPAAVVDGLGRDGRLARWVVGWRRALVAAALAVAVVSAAVYFTAARGSVGGVDFYYYVCAARDMVTHRAEVSDNCYLYFPGVYAFWRGVMRAGWVSEPAVQCCYVAVLLVNAVLLAALVMRMLGRPVAAMFAALWYLVVVTRFDGLAGVSEPLATAVVLAGLLAWGGEPLRGRRGFILAILLGVAMGVTVYVKQQAALLTVATAALLLCRPWMDRPRRHTWAHLAIVPAVAVAVFLAGILLEGRGWTPLNRGLAMAAGYGREGTIFGNLYTQIRGDESAALAAGLAVLAWCIVFWKSRHASRIGSGAFQVASFAVIAFLASLVQFSSRPFGHYMLLGLPFLILAAVLLAHEIVPWMTGRAAQSHLTAYLLLGAAAVVFANTSGRADTLHVWRPVLPRDFEPLPVWHRQPGVASDLADLADVVPPDSTMYIVPARRNALYYALGTRTANPDGYWFFLRDPHTMPWNECAFVLLLTRGLNEYDLQFCSPSQMHAVRRELARRGFIRRLSGRLRMMELHENPARRG